MTSDIENLTAKTDNLSINPVYHTNWCDMPVEIKSECIEKMDLNERLSLRCTAKAERSLVDSQKIEFSWGDIDIEISNKNHYVVLTSENQNLYPKKFEDPRQAFEFLNYILKIANFDNFHFSSNDPADKEDLKKYTGKISAKNIELYCFDNDMIVAVLQKVKNGVESITIDGDGISTPLDEILAISQVQNAKYWHIVDYKETDLIVEKVSKLIISGRKTVKESEFGPKTQIVTFFWSVD
ncbi:unnamed protein product [Caenorhabditis nigoni]